MKGKSVDAMHFGKIDKPDYFIPPFALFYFYLVFAAALGWPAPSTRELFDSEAVRWIGVALCAAGLTLLAWTGRNASERRASLEKDDAEADPTAISGKADTAG